MPLVSVIIPSYNSARYVAAAVDSVLQQSFTDFEVLVIDDGSTDDTRSVLGRYGSPVRYVYQPNGGVSVARNTGIAASAGRYVAFLDADDTWFPEKLERQMAALGRTSKFKLCCSGCRFVDDEMRLLRDYRPRQRSDTLEGLLFEGNIITSICTVIVERELLNKVGGFDPELSQCADWDMWIRLARHTEFLVIEEPLVTYRQHVNNMSRSAPLLERDSVRVLEKAFNDPATPERLRSRAVQALGRNWMVLAGCYFQGRSYRDFARCATRALRLDPSQSIRLFTYPVRILSRAARGARR